MDKEPGAEEEVEERFRFHPNADLWIIYFKDRLMDFFKIVKLKTQLSTWVSKPQVLSQKVLQLQFYVTTIALFKLHLNQSRQTNIQWTNKTSVLSMYQTYNLDNTQIDGQSRVNNLNLWTR